MAAARSGAGAVTVLVLLKAAKMTLDASKLLFWAVQHGPARVRRGDGRDARLQRRSDGMRCCWGAVGGARGGHAGQGRLQCAQNLNGCSSVLIFQNFRSKRPNRSIFVIFCDRHFPRFGHDFGPHHRKELDEIRILAGSPHSTTIRSL